MWPGEGDHAEQRPPRGGAAAIVTEPAAGRGGLLVRLSGGVVGHRRRLPASLGFRQPVGACHPRIEGILEDVDRVGLRRREQPASDDAVALGELCAANGRAELDVEPCLRPDRPRPGPRPAERLCCGSRSVSDDPPGGEHDPAIAEAKAGIEVESARRQNRFPREKPSGGLSPGQGRDGGLLARGGSLGHEGRAGGWGLIRSKKVRKSLIFRGRYGFGRGARRSAIEICVAYRTCLDYRHTFMVFRWNVRLQDNRSRPASAPAVARL